MDLAELRRDLRSELDDAPAPPPALERIVRRARRQVRVRRAVRAAVVAGVVSVAFVAVDRVNEHNRRVDVTNEPRSTTTPPSKPTTTTVGFSASEQAALARIPGDSWVFGLLEKSLSSWQSVRGVETFSGGAAPQQPFAVARAGDFYWQLGSDLTRRDGDAQVEVEARQKVVIVSLLAPAEPPTTTFERQPDGSSPLPGEEPTNTAGVNEMVSPTYLLRRSVGPRATAVHVVGSDRVAGRDTWKTEIDFPTAIYKQPWTWWIDKQTGVVLKSVTAGYTKEFTDVAFDQPYPTAPNPTVPKGYTIRVLLFAGGANYEATLARDTPLAEIIANARNGTLRNFSIDTTKKQP
jgi:hypothetical protein